MNEGAAAAGDAGSSSPEVSSVPTEKVAMNPLFRNRKLEGMIKARPKRSELMDRHILQDTEAESEHRKEARKAINKALKVRGVSETAEPAAADEPEVHTETAEARHNLERFFDRAASDSAGSGVIAGRESEYQRLKERHIIVDESQRSQRSQAKAAISNFLIKETELVAVEGVGMTTVREKRRLEKTAPVSDGTVCIF